MADFFVCRISRIPAEVEDQLSEICFSFGAEGVSQNLAFSQPNLEYQSQIVVEDVINLDVYFLHVPETKFVERVRSLIPDVSITVVSEKNKDWLSEWKKHFFPFELTNGVWVVPSWLSPPPEAKEVLAIDPGMAFGTGHHATTRLSAKLLAKIVTEQQTNSLLDVGTGTAVLALLAEKLGVENVVGIDNDPEALRVASENLLANSSRVKIWTQDLAQVESAFEIVVANIIDSVLLRLQPELLRTSTRGIIVSGVLVEREGQFISRFTEKTELNLVERLTEDGWSAFYFKKG